MIQEQISLDGFCRGCPDGCTETVTFTLSPGRYELDVASVCCSYRIAAESEEDFRTHISVESAIRDSLEFNTWIQRLMAQLHRETN